MGQQFQDRERSSTPRMENESLQCYGLGQKESQSNFSHCSQRRKSSHSAPPPEPNFSGLSQELGAVSQSGLIVQPKLMIGAPNDRYEQEADRVAAQVMRRMHGPIQQELSTEEPGLQLKPMVQPAGSMAGGMEAPSDVAAGIAAARGGGQPLDELVRVPMEQSFGADFSRVRVHTDARSDGLNAALGARAFTTGQDLFFKRGTYQPSSRVGQELIAHELTHVAQQKGIKTLQRAFDESYKIAFMDKQKTGKHNSLKSLGGTNQAVYKITFDQGQEYVLKLFKGVRASQLVQKSILLADKIGINTPKCFLITKDELSKSITNTKELSEKKYEMVMVMEFIKGKNLEEWSSKSAKDSTYEDLGKVAAFDMLIGQSDRFENWTENDRGHQENPRNLLMIDFSPTLIDIDKFSPSWEETVFSPTTLEKLGTRREIHSELLDKTKIGQIRYIALNILKLVGADKPFSWPKGKTEKKIAVAEYEKRKLLVQHGYLQAMKSSEEEKIPDELMEAIEQKLSEREGELKRLLELRDLEKIADNNVRAMAKKKRMDEEAQRKQYCAIM